MTKNSVLAQIRELRTLQRGLPKGPYRQKIGEDLQKYYSILSGMEASDKTVISKILFNNKPKPFQKGKSATAIECSICKIMVGDKNIRKHMRKQHSIILSN